MKNPVNMVLLAFGIAFVIYVISMIFMDDEEPKENGYHIEALQR